MSAPTAAVVGGGISGLVAALELAAAGFAVEIVEATDRLGGPLLTGEVGGVQVDLGAESFLNRRPEGIDLAAELGLGGDVVHPQRAAPVIMRGGTGYPLPPGTVFGVPGDPAALAGLLTPAEIVRATAEAVVPWTGDVSVAELVGARLGRAVVDRVVDPMLGGVYAGSAARLSAEATLPALVAAVRRGSGLRAAVADGDRSDPSPVFAGLRGGVGRLAGAAMQALTDAGVRISTRDSVTGIERDGLGWRVTSAGGSRPVAGVVLATPAPVAARLLGGVAPAAAAHLSVIDVADVAVVAVAVPTAALPAPSGSGVLVPAVEGHERGLAVKAVTFSSVKWTWVAGQDPAVSILRASIGRAGESAGYGHADEELAGIAVRDLGALLGVPVRPIDVRLQRWPGSLPQYPVGHVVAMARVMAQIDAQPGLGLAGSHIAGVGIPACIATGRAAASKVVMDITARASLDELRGEREH